MMLETKKLQFQTIISFVLIEIDMVEASSFTLRTPTSLQWDRNLWSWDDRKGYFPEDQQFFLSIFPNETAAYFVITAPPI